MYKHSVLWHPSLCDLVRWTFLLRHGEGRPGTGLQGNLPRTAILLPPACQGLLCCTMCNHAQLQWKTIKVLVSDQAALP